MKYIIGIDVGGTNTDFVVTNEHNEILHSHKQLTTSPISDGIIEYINRSILKKFNQKEIKHISIGTTYALNAILEAKRLSKVGLIRLSGHAPNAISPCYEWPEKIKEQISLEEKTLPGGFECNKKEISKISFELIDKTIEIFTEKNITEIAICGAFSPIYNEQEEIVHKYIFEKYKIDSSCSYKIGTIGIIERENATILNCTLKNAFLYEFSNLKNFIEKTGITLYIVQNNGTIENFDFISKYPIKTIASGTTNSCIGGAKLANTENAIVVDIGGTSTDICFINNGFPVKSSIPILLGGVSLQCESPEVFSIGLGGGSIISENENEITIGPQSVAKNVKTESISFGGKIKTLTDCAIAIDTVQINNAKKSIKMDNAEKILEIAYEKIKSTIDKKRGFAKKTLPVVFVGGGAEIFKDKIKNDGFIIPKNASVANAYGAACAEISYTKDIIIEGVNEEVLNIISEEAIEKIKNNGAKNNIRIIEKRILPFHYIPGNKARIIISAAGRIN
jgi:N-methylhydantoinase A/oxoprolinase/acetone carboxylase beta subunit